MSYSESDLVKVATAPPNQENLLDEVGFVNATPENGLVEVAILDTKGLRDIFLISEAFLVSEDSVEARNLFNSYKNTLDEINREADARQRKKVQVTSHLARKYNIGPDEVHGIYKAMLHYEKYHEDHLTKSGLRR
jgi:hypothetical protein